MLAEIGEAHGKSVAQVVLRWLVQRDVVVIPKSVRAERMAENFDVFGFELTEEEMTRIAELDTGASVFFDHRDPRDDPDARRAPRSTDPQQAVPRSTESTAPVTEAAASEAR